MYDPAGITILDEGGFGLNAKKEILMKDEALRQQVNRAAIGALSDLSGMIAGAKGTMITPKQAKLASPLDFKCFGKAMNCSSIRTICIVLILAIFMTALIGDSSAYAAGSVVVDTGGTSWVLGSSALVLFMTLPGLALFYGGLVRPHNFLSVVVQCFAICCVVSVIWGLFGYSLAFGDGGPLIGSLDKVFLMNLGDMKLPGNLPEIVFVLFQMMFAIITPALIIGAYVERVKLSFVIVFSALWLVLVYLPITHWVWGGGWLNKLGIMDFAGGIVVHTTAGVSALVAAVLIGVRRGFPDNLAAPYSLGMTMAGTGMLWVGWFGFNGGSALAANFTAGSAILATHFAAVTAGLTWVGVERLRNGKATILGLVSGCVAGLATITPAAGFVGPMGGMVIGIASGVCCFFATRFVTQFLKVDDSLGVFGVHGVGGMLGSILVAFFAASSLGGAGFGAGMDMGRQFLVQVSGVCATAAWSAIATYVLVKSLYLIMGIRISAEEESIGLDISPYGQGN